MKKCLLYGNCQIDMIHKIFLETFLINEYDFTYIRCYNNAENNIKYVDISAFDLIIIQPVYQLVEYKNTLSILKKKKRDCVVIIIHSLYFSFYFLNEIHCDSFKINNDQLRLPIDYHDKNLIDLYLKYGIDKKSIVNKYQDMIFSSNFYSEDLYLTTYKNSIKNLKERFTNFLNLYKDFHPIYFIPIADFIEKNYQNDLLWHSRIHPKYDPVLKFLCSEILFILNKDTNLPNNFYKHNYEHQLPLYQSISSLVNFNTEQYATAKIKERLVNIEDFVDIYLKVYNDKKTVKYINRYRDISFFD